MMTTRMDIRTMLRLAIGCLFCLALAALGFYPFSDARRGRDHAVRACARRGVRALIP